jgi:hypothetical protein
MFAPDAREHRRIGDIALDQLEIAPGAERPRAVALELRRVVVVEIVETEDALAAGDQRLGDISADEAGGAGDASTATLVLRISPSSRSSAAMSASTLGLAAALAGAGAPLCAACTARSIWRTLQSPAMACLARSRAWATGRVSNARAWPISS